MTRATGETTTAVTMTTRTRSRWVVGPVQPIRETTTPKTTRGMEWAHDHDLPYFDDQVHFPDLRIEYKENTTERFFPISPSDPGSMILTATSTLPPGWTVYDGPIMWMYDGNTRWGGRLKAFEGSFFVDLTGNGGNRTGGLGQRIRTRPGRTYQVSLALGMDDSRGDASGPVEVRVLFVAYFTGKPIGALTFRQNRGTTGDVVWTPQSQDVALTVDPLEQLDEDIADLIARVTHLTADATDPHRTELIVLAEVERLHIDVAAGS